jgi:copper(I)-binding protein
MVITHPRSLLHALCLAAAFVIGPAATQLATAHDYKLGPLEIAHPWTRATPKGATVAGGYLKVTNTGTAPDRLIGGSNAAAGRLEIHEMKLVDNVMQMRPLPAGLEIKPGQTVELKPGSYHLMFMQLKAPLEPGKSVKGTLVFEKAGTIEVEYTVEAIGAAATTTTHPRH